MPPKRKRGAAAAAAAKEENKDAPPSSSSPPAAKKSRKTRTKSNDDEEDEKKKKKKNEEDKLQSPTNENKGEEDVARDDDEKRRQQQRQRQQQRAKEEKVMKSCPYLSFVNRPLLDFDFEKRCSVSLIQENCYCCLTCGHFFAGRGPKTPAYTHSLERENHHVFMRLENGRAFCLPENYEVFDKSLDDVRKVLFPRFTSEEVASLEKEAMWSKALDGSEFLVGVVGLNRVENARGVNPIVQSLARVEKLRARFLLSSSSSSSLPGRDGGSSNNNNENDTLQSLCQRIWNKHNFRGHTSPDAFVRKLRKQIKLANPEKLETDIDNLFNDPFATLRHFLTFVVPKKYVDEFFRGELLMLNQNNKKQPFVFVPLKLPDAPLFRDVMEKNAIPQVALAELLKPFALKTAPEYLILAFVNRFSKNQFTKEVSKNPTIVTFPVKNLKISSSDNSNSGTTTTVSYDLLANVDSAGKATVKHVDGNWYETNDLLVNEVLAQQVTLGEAYVQIYKRVVV